MISTENINSEIQGQENQNDPLVLVLPEQVLVIKEASNENNNRFQKEKLPKSIQRDLMKL